MQSSDDKSLIPIPIASDAASGNVATIPLTQATAGDGRVCLELGYPPECAISVAAGGKFPEMQDANGVYRLLSSAIKSIQAWGILPFNSDFATAIGGYPKYAVCVDSSGAYWISGADNNTTVPGATNATWVSLFNGYATQVWVGNNTPGRLLGVSVFNASGTYTPPSTTATTRFRVRACGAGGGGDYVGTQISYTASSGGGGSAGAYCEVWLTYAQLFGSTAASSVSITVGAGGSNTGNGGSTSVGNAIYAPGGNGANNRNSGSYSTLSSGASETALCTFPAGTPVICSNVAGAGGAYGIATNPQQGGNYYGFSGAGGSSPLGAGGPSSGANTAGQNGGIGAGGSGGCAYGGIAGTSTGYTGGKGGDGVVIIECYTWS